MVNRQQTWEYNSTWKNGFTKNFGKRRRKFLSQQLNDLGIQTDDAINWYKSNTKDGKFDFYTAKEADFYKQDLTRGANRFTKEIILNPSTAEGNRPLWFGTPAAQMLVQFAGYPTVFNNTILKRFAYEGLNNPLQAGMSKILPTMLLMTSVAHVGNLIRSNGNSVNDYETGKRKTDGAIIHRGIYEDSKEKLRAYTMIGGLDAPTKRLEELKKFLKIR